MQEFVFAFAGNLLLGAYVSHPAELATVRGTAASQKKRGLYCAYVVGQPGCAGPLGG